MKIKCFYGVLAILTLLNCGGVNNNTFDSCINNNCSIIKSTEYQDSSEFVDDIRNKVSQLLVERKYTSFETLQIQKLNRIERNSEVLLANISKRSSLKTGNEIYNHLKECTMFIGISYLCDKCPKIHLNKATGFVIHEDGVIVTNYHVIDAKRKVKASAIFAANHKGDVYPVSHILSTSKLNDLAILQLDTKGEKLKPLELAEEELMGEEVFVMGHPFDNIFFMTNGVVANKYRNSQSMPKIAITADFGQGASGGAVVNKYGEVIGVVSTTYTRYSNNSKTYGNIQMVVKEIVPVSVLNGYVNKDE